MKALITMRLVVAATAASAAAIVAVTLGLADVAALAAPWFVLLVLGARARQPAPPSLQIEIDDNRVRLGDAVDLAASVTLTAPGFVTVVPLPQQRFRERLSPQLTSSQPQANVDVTELHACAAGTTTAVTRSVTPTEWGTWDLGNCRFSVTSRHGLFAQEWRVQTEHTVQVQPDTQELRELVAPRFIRRITGLHHSNEAARGIEYADIRPFTSSDQVRDINWRASARAQELYVSDRHPDRSTDVVLLLDSFVETGHDVRRVHGLAVNAALAVGNVHLGATDRVGLVEFGGVVRWLVPGIGDRQLHRLTDALLASALYANAADKELPLLSPKIWPSRSLVVAISPLLDERFVAALHEARARGHDVAVIECAPLVEAVDELTAVEATSRRLWHAERVAMRAELADHGVAVAAWHPDDPLELVLSWLKRVRRGLVQRL